MPKPHNLRYLFPVMDNDIPPETFETARNIALEVNAKVDFDIESDEGGVHITWKSEHTFLEIIVNPDGQTCSFYGECEVPHMKIYGDASTQINFRCLGAWIDYVESA